MTNKEANKKRKKCFMERRIDDTSKIWGI